MWLLELNLFREWKRFVVFLPLGLEFADGKFCRPSFYPNHFLITDVVLSFLSIISSAAEDITSSLSASLCSACSTGVWWVDHKVSRLLHLWIMSTVVVDSSKICFIISAGGFQLSQTRSPVQVRQQTATQTAEALSCLAVWHIYPYWDKISRAYHRFRHKCFVGSPIKIILSPCLTLASVF